MQSTYSCLALRGAYHLYLGYQSANPVTAIMTQDQTITASSPLILSPVDYAADHAAIFDLTAKAFSGGHNYWKWHQICRGGYFEPSHYNPAASVIGRVDGVAVTHVGVWDFQMRIGNAVARVGGIGAVATHGEYRKHGYMHSTFAQCVAQMRAQGFHFSLLYGIRNYYSRFGYTPAWADRAVTVKPADLIRRDPQTALQPEKSILTGEFVALHTKANAGLTGTAMRPTYPSLLPFDEGPAYSLRLAGGELIGAIQTKRDGRRLNVVEAFGDGAELLAHTARLCESEHCDELVFRKLHPRSALAQLITTDNCKVETFHDRDGGAMARVISLEPTLRQLLPELAGRLRTVIPAGMERPLLLADGEQALMLEITRTDATLTALPISTVNECTHPDAILSPRGFSRLLLGSGDPLVELANGRVDARGLGKLLLPVLFPAQEPILSAIDFF
ncbi:MAG: GNAT family N-acetyltransferase [Verrucomicrobiota bacterium]|nr:GNAT family N-acetyltransferase [Verrucomicrobiota bacterium]